MVIVFVTFGDFNGHATLKRATGMSAPLISSGHEVHILLEDSPSNREKVSMECPTAVIHWHIRERSPWAEWKIKQRTLNQLNPDTVWICGVGLRNWMRRPTPDSILLADHSELYSAVATGFLRRAFYGLLEWGYCFYFDGQICASRYLEAFYLRRLKSLKKKDTPIHYSPYAFHPDVISPNSEAAAAVQGRFPQKKLILYMGSFWENYGFWDMLEAFRRLSLTRSDFVALFAGRGPEQERGESWVRENGLSDKIVIEGYVPEEQLSAYFTAAHAFLSPLRDTIQDWARCPSKLYMYLPFNKPVITCPIGEAKELFGEQGMYYKPGDINGLTEVIERVLDENNPEGSTNPQDHTYAARTKDFLDWYKSTFSK